MYWKLPRLSAKLSVLAAVSAAAIAIHQNNEKESSLDKDNLQENVKKEEKTYQINIIQPSVKKNLADPTRLSEAISKSQRLVNKCQIKNGAPGIAVAVSVDGASIWQEGFGYSDIENEVNCTPDTVMRIASISKPLTMAVVAKLWEEGKIDLDKPVQHYVTNFPQKTFNDEDVTVTCRHLVGHTSGIRHYPKRKEAEPGQAAAPADYETLEFLKKDKFSTVDDALKIFKDDDLLFKPGTNYLYTTHGFTLISAIVEAVVKTPFAEYMKKTFSDFGMHRTTLDVYEPLIYNRSRYYLKNKKGLIENAPYVDNSYKWAGGGFVSCVTDLLRFGNLMLYSYQHTPEHVSTTENGCKGGEILPGFLSRQTVEKLWSPSSTFKSGDHYYGMGWGVRPEEKAYYCNEKKFVAAHSGGAVGASSVLLIMPRTDPKVDSKLPQGVVVAMLTNLQAVSLGNEAFEIAQIFSQLTE